MGFFAGAAAFISGASSMVSANAERKDKIKDYQQNLSTLADNKAISDNNALSTFNSNKSTLNNSIEAISNSIEDTTDTRNTSLATGSTAAHGTSELATLNYATLLGTVKQNEGVGLAKAASSGFRMSDSALNTYSIAKSNGDTSVQSFKLQTDLANNSNYASIAANYTNANNQIDSYQFQKTVNETKLATTKTDYATSKNLSQTAYDTQKTYIDKQINYLDGEGKWTSWVTGLLELAGTTTLASVSPTP